MHIVIVDGYTANPGDLSWAAFEQCGSLAVWDRTAPRERFERCTDAEAIITNKVVLDRPLLERLPRLKYIGVTATGHNIVDSACARQRGIVVTNVPNYCTASVAQHVFALIFELAHRVGLHDASVHAGRWSRSPDFSYWDTPQVELTGKTIGLIGYGHIAQAVARIALAMDMKVIVQTRTPRAAAGVEFTDRETIFRVSDVMSLHCPLTPDTAQMVNAATLALMKPTAFLINTARGALVDEAALAQALRDGRIAGAGVDVLSAEPPPADNPLLAAPNCIITPHIAWASREARANLIHHACENLKAFLAGAPINVVNGLPTQTR